MKMAKNKVTDVSFWRRRVLEIGTLIGAAMVSVGAIDLIGNEWGSVTLLITGIALTSSAAIFRVRER